MVVHILSQLNYIRTSWALLKKVIIAHNYIVGNTNNNINNVQFQLGRKKTREKAKI